MIQLRPYQTNIIQGVRNSIKQSHKNIILTAPTGAGKTIMFCYIISRAVANKNRCLILTDRTELLTQSGGALSNFDLEPIEITPKLKGTIPYGPLYTAMAKTLKRRLAKQGYIDLINDLDIIIIDEAHKQEFNTILPFISDKTIVIGATATPLRESKQDSLDLFYTDIVSKVTISELIKNGYLSTPHTYGVEIDLKGIKTKGGDYDPFQMGKMYTETKLYKGVYENYQRLTPNKKALIFASNVESSKALVKELSERGLNIKHLDANSKNRTEILEWFENTPDALLSNVGILNTGFDCPSVEVVILYRATKSLPLFLQMCGRGSRTTKTKKDFYILDFGNNIERHGFWQEDREWSLKKKVKREGIAPIKICKPCGAINYATAKVCECCGLPLQKTKKEEHEEEIERLKKLNYNQVDKKNFNELELYCEAKGYNKRWILRQLKTNEDIKRYAKYKGYANGWIQRNQK